MMAANPPLAERLDIHKSCKSIENLLAVFNDYCEAAGAIVTLQKKLSKALRETAGMKVTNDIAANALNSSAAIFEALGDIDAKFAKIADKEYDAISSEVKKWFKKLAKEEKAHDEKIAATNAKIKQAGQVYERRSKKNPREANDEHARYINLISTVGPEISQEKHNHSLLVTQRHTSTTYSLAACVSRVADAEWTKACEGVRRFSPTIGKLGEWRALCEGGWTGPIPQDLPDIDYPPQQPLADTDHPALMRRFEDDERYTAPTLRTSPTGMEHFPEQPGMTTGTSTPTYEREPDFSSPQRQYQVANDTPSREKAPPTSFSFSNKFVDDNTGSVRSLSAFPSPPTHFPLPQVLTQRQQQPLSSAPSFPALARPDRSPVAETVEDSPVPTRLPTVPSSPVQKKLIDTTHPIDSIEESNGVVSDGASSGPSRSKAARTETLDPNTYRSPEPITSSTSEQSPSPSRPFARGDYMTEEPESMAGIRSGNRQRTSFDGGRSKRIERSDTNTSNGSIVAQMRNRYTNNSGSSSPPLPKDIPRLPMSVGDLASKYGRPTSPSGSRPHPSIDTQTRQAEPTTFRERESPSTAGYRSTGVREGPPASPPSVPAAPADDDFAARRRQQQRAEQMAELELREKEQELRRREQVIEQRARELEKERAQLMLNANASSAAESSNNNSNTTATVKPRERQLSFQQDQLRRPLSDNLQLESSPTSPLNISTPQPIRGALRHSQYSASATHLVPPSASSRPSYGGIDEDGEYRRPRSSSSRDPSVTSTTSISASTSTSPVMSSASPTREKKGWMRRLSMPIVAGNPFLDSKKHTSNHSYGGKGGILSLDSRKNGGIASFMKGGMVGEDGRVMGGSKSYEIGSGISNRSVTNFNDRR
ncbi:hypothetical protein Moror_14314 [Moniliophthora roreri MCA 2997]|uniref:Uncharacterized protein n=1 Tax=Moniliophthora roreri (strain MCA 2997) TaxID=1381753 RepID=V2X6A9_MONRO|nr:hypothetical protein Moror_14314 [Moniliophthora roreri MCA 2997]